MTLPELKSEIRKYHYFEDDSIIDTCLASIIATRLKLGDPIWMTIIGPSSGGKSQLLRPLALTQPKFMHRIDDLTENTFLSGIGSDKRQYSLLHRIGKHGMIVLSDLTVLFSKNSEAKNAILSQFRMLYDGEMTKHSGSSDKPITWSGYLGVLAGSTPSIYAHFEEVSDMGERFIYYRLKDHDDRKSSNTAIHRKHRTKETDEALADLYRAYIKEKTENAKDMSIVELTPEVTERIITIARFAEKIRTPIHMNQRETYINRIPITAFSARSALQLSTLARGLSIVHDGITEKTMEIIEWCGWSLANEEKRAILKILAEYPYAAGVSTQNIADKVGLSTEATGFILQGMAAIGVLKRTGDSSSLYWHIAAEEEWKLIQKIAEVTELKKFTEQRALSTEEQAEMKEVSNIEFEQFGK